MPEKLGNKGYGDIITPLTTPLKKGDPRSPVNNPPVVNVKDPLNLLPGSNRGFGKGGRKK